MDDEEELKKREEELRRDRINQAKWYESLNLFAEALRIYKSVGDSENMDRVEKRMNRDYSEKAKELEDRGRYQEAANLYYLIGDNANVDRMRERKPDLVIHYDEESGGIAQLASDIYQKDRVGATSDEFYRPNTGSVEEISPNGDEVGILDVEREEKSESSRKKLPVKMPRKKPMRYCPYCGENIVTKREPKFCPYCGEEL